MSINDFISIKVYRVKLYLEEVEDIAYDLHDGEHADTGGDGGDAGVHVLVGGHLLILDTD